VLRARAGREQLAHSEEVVTDLRAKLDALTPEQRELVAAFSEGLAPILGAGELAALAEACDRDDRRLTQGVTVFPWGSVESNRHLPAERCCAVSFARGLARGKTTVGEVWDAFGAARDTLTTLLPLEAFWRFAGGWDRLPRAEALGATALACRMAMEKGTVAA
jgi:hypothetical protein